MGRKFELHFRFQSIAFVFVEKLWKIQIILDTGILAFDSARVWWNFSSLLSCSVWFSVFFMASQTQSFSHTHCRDLRRDHRRHHHTSLISNACIRESGEGCVCGASPHCMLILSTNSYTTSQPHDDENGGNKWNGQIDGLSHSHSAKLFHSSASSPCSL